ncbi:hypothetical protein Efla_002216 [Eimeria flavescens]
MIICCSGGATAAATAAAAAAAAATAAARRNSDSQALAPSKAESENEERTSGLEAPTLRLTGHTGELYAVRFSVDGRNVATAGADRSVLVYNVYGECRSWLQLRGHRNAILDLAWSEDGTRLYTASADESLAMWDVESGERIKILRGGDDGTTRVWDLRTRKCVLKAQHHYQQILAVALDGVGCRVFAGSLDNTIREYDMRAGLREAGVLEGHQDSVTGLDVHPDGSHLLSNAMDHTVRHLSVSFFSFGLSVDLSVLLILVLFVCLPVWVCLSVSVCTSLSVCLSLFRLFSGCCWCVCCLSLSFFLRPLFVLIPLPSR